jgi:hypothetical protein
MIWLARQLQMLTFFQIFCAGRELELSRKP